MTPLQHHSDRARLIRIARGLEPADLVVRNCRLVNVLSGEIERRDIAVAQGLVVGFSALEARRELDAKGRHLCPGFVEGHIHIESTLLSPAEFCRVAAFHGTAAVVCDPHEIANVLGMSGIRYMLEATKGLPVSVYVMASSCVPATHLETSGAEIGADDIAALFAQYPERMPGLAEMMNYPGVLACDDEVLSKLAAARGRLVDGHCPLLSGSDLDAYILAGPGSEHECTCLDEAAEKLAKGMHIHIREGTAEHNLRDLVPLVNGRNAQNFSFVSDDRHPADLAANGHLDHLIRLAIGAGMAPVRAVQLATVNTARHYGLQGRGVIAPGYRADFVLLDDLESFTLHEAYLAGRPVAELAFPALPPPGGNSMRVAPITPKSFQIEKPADKSRLRAIGVVPHQILTTSEIVKAKLEGSLAAADPERDLAKLALIERHRGSGNIGLGFIRGLGVRRGAIASTVAHDSHNLIVAGASDGDMALAAGVCIEDHGGFSVVCDNEVLARLPLPVAGLMSSEDLDTVLAQYEALHSAWERLGVVGHNPFMILSFMALPVIASLKLTDRGLFDVDAFEFTDLWVD